MRVSVRHGTGTTRRGRVAPSVVKHGRGIIWRGVAQDGLARSGVVMLCQSWRGEGSSPGTVELGSVEFGMASLITVGQGYLHGRLRRR